MRKRIVYWLSEEVGSVHREKAAGMQARGYDVKFFNTYNALVAELKTRRASIIIVGDETSEAKLIEYIIDLSIRPELQGARFVLSVARFRPKIARAAASCSFRDILPLSLPVKQWLLRFSYATAGAAMEMEKPQPQVALNEISALYMPARIVWINQQEIHLETRVRPEIGSVLSLGGDLPRALGTKALSLKVLKRTKTNLAYRFSDGLTAKWSVPQAFKEIASENLTAIKPNHFGRRKKVFIAIQSPQLRERMVQKLEPMEFVLSVALKKNSMIHEPFYFSPEIIVVEEKLLTEDYFKRYVEMVKKLASSVPVLVIGQSDTVRKLREIDPNRIIHGQPEVGDKLTETIFKLIDEGQGPDHAQNEEAVYLDPKSSQSMGEIRFSARLRQLHPTTATIDLPFSVGSYALGRIDSPLIKKIIKRAPAIKVTNSYKRADEISSPFKFRIETILSDTFENESEMLTAGLLEFIQAELTAKMSFANTKSKAPDSATKPAAQINSSRPAGNPINDLSINSVTFDLGGQNKASDSIVAQKTEVERNLDSVAEQEEERMTQLITQDVAETQPQTDYAEHIKRSRPVHIEVGDYSYKPTVDRDRLPGRLGDVVGSRRNLNILILLGFLSFVGAIFYFTKVYIERDWGKDQGKVFVDSLRGYAPKAFERGLPRKKGDYPPPARREDN